MGPVSFGLRTSNNHGIPLGSRCHFIHFHPSSHLLPRSTTTVQGGHYYSALKHLVRLTGPMSPRWRVELGLTPRLSVFKVMCSNYKLCIIWPHQKDTRKRHECITQPQNQLLPRGTILLCCLSFSLITGPSFLAQCFGNIVHRELVVTKKHTCFWPLPLSL